MTRVKNGDLVEVSLKENTHLAESKNTRNAFRGTSLDDGNNQLAGQAELIPVNENDLFDRMESYRLVDRRYEKPSLCEKLNHDVFYPAIRDFAWTIYDELVCPAANYFWYEKALPKIKSIWYGLKCEKTKAEQIVEAKKVSMPSNVIIFTPKKTA